MFENVQKGQTIEILTASDNFKGVVHNITRVVHNNDQYQIALHKVEDLSTGEVYNYLHYFTSNEIRKLKILSEQKSKVISNKVTNNKNGKCELNDAEDELLKALRSSTVEDVPDILQKPKWKLHLSLLKRIENMQSNIFYIDKINAKYTNAIKQLEITNCISLDSKFTRVNNKVLLSLLIVATLDDVYVFDVKILNRKVFLNGLQNVFENTFITKVIHSSTQLNGCLKNQFNIIMKNVCDTQLMDLHVRKTTVKRNLNECLTSYLNAPSNVIVVDNIDDNCWNVRPVPLHLRIDISDGVAYLIPLKEALDKIVLAEFYKQIDDEQQTLCNMNPGDCWGIVNQTIIS